MWLNEEELLKKIELCGRVCYKSEDKINEESTDKFIAGIIKRGHESVLEHVNISVRFICDRGVTHEIVRHRLASYSQESTRYCNYSQDKFDNEIIVIEPCFFDEINKRGAEEDSRPFCPPVRSLQLEHKPSENCQEKNRNIRSNEGRHTSIPNMVVLTVCIQTSRGSKGGIGYR